MQSRPAADPEISPEIQARERQWYKDAVIYQLHVRAFYDSNGDGVGDFKGLMQKMSYLHELGINAIWLQPFYPSPLKDDGYDIADYEQINPQYGDLDDFKNFLAAAHDCHIKVITELVINHTSDQHDWFQRSRRAPPGSYWRDFYVWSDDPNKYDDVRIIFKDFETSNWTYDPVAKSYYWHRFYAHQPDLNFDNPHVRKEIFRLLDYWLEMGVDGLRLDAVPYLFEREGTSCENLPETHAFLKTLRAYVDERYENRMLLAEANQWPEDAVAYFGQGDECHMCFHFPLMPRLFMAIKTEDRFSVMDILHQTPAIPESCQWATFLRNHDELTLEMVTDEERDYMYNVYASEPQARINLGIRRRLASLLNNDRRQIELLNMLLYAMPGTPIIYYGDEIGMGDNIYLGDRNGVRTPFQWSPDRNAGFSAADPQKLYLPVIISPEYHYETINVDTQKANQNSLWRWTKRLIEMRKNSPALTRGTLRFLEPKNSKVLALIREWPGDETSEKETVLIVANLSKRAQYVELDMADYESLVPQEMTGETSFPAIGELPYLITLGPYDCYWFTLKEAEALETSGWLLSECAALGVTTAPLDVLHEPSSREYLERLIAAYLPKTRWFAGKRSLLERVRIADIIPVQQEHGRYSLLALIDVYERDHKDSPDTYLITIGYAEGQAAADIQENRPDLIIGEYHYVRDRNRKGVYHEAILDSGFATALLHRVLAGEKSRGDNGWLEGKTHMPVADTALHTLPEPYLASCEQSNTSLRFGEEYFFKLFRCIREGINPDVEVGAYLNRAGFENAPRLVGSLNYTAGGKSYSFGALHAHVKAEGSAWDFFEAQLSLYIEAALGHDIQRVQEMAAQSFFDLHEDRLPSWFRDQNAYTASLMKLLGRRTGELHLVLAADDRDTAFIPEDFTPFYQRSLYQSLHNQLVQTKIKLQTRAERGAAEMRDLRDRLLGQWRVIEKHLAVVKREHFGGKRIRIHGDYHLGQILYTGNDFMILDFEGEPLRTISSRRLKRSGLKDAAGLLRSIDYLIQLYRHRQEGEGHDTEELQPFLRLWRSWMSRAFMDGYLEAMEGGGLLPKTENYIQDLTEIFMIDKAMYEIEYELASRPEWVDVPLRGLLDILPVLHARNRDAA